MADINPLEHPDHPKTYTKLVEVAKAQGYNVLKYAGTDHLVLVSEGSGQYVYGGRGHDVLSIASFLAIPTIP